MEMDYNSSQVVWVKEHDGSDGSGLQLITSGVGKRVGWLAWEWTTTHHKRCGQKSRMARMEVDYNSSQAVWVIRVG